MPRCGNKKRGGAQRDGLSSGVETATHDDRVFSRYKEESVIEERQPSTRGYPVGGAPGYSEKVVRVLAKGGNGSLAESCP